MVGEDASGLPWGEGHRCLRAVWVGRKFHMFSVGGPQPGKE